MSITEDYDWSDLESKVETRESNVLPRSGTARTAGGTRRGTRRSSKRLDDLKTSLGTQMFQAGAMISLGMPVTGTYICQEAETFPDAVIQLAKKHTEWIEALERVSDIGPGITIGRTVLGIFAAAGTDRYHRTNGESGFDPDKRALNFLGVTQAYYAVHKDEADATETGYTPAPHGIFTPVS